MDPHAVLLYYSTDIVHGWVELNGVPTTLPAGATVQLVLGDQSKSLGNPSDFTVTNQDLYDLTSYHDVIDQFPWGNGICGAGFLVKDPPPPVLEAMANHPAQADAILSAYALALENGQSEQEAVEAALAVPTE